jgi:hypothetical protein
VSIQLHQITLLMFIVEQRPNQLKITPKRLSPSTEVSSLCNPAHAWSYTLALAVLAFTRLS